PEPLSGAREPLPAPALTPHRGMAPSAQERRASLYRRHALPLHLSRAPLPRDGPPVGLAAEPAARSHPPGGLPAAPAEVKKDERSLAPVLEARNPGESLHRHRIPPGPRALPIAPGPERARKAPWTLPLRRPLPHRVPPGKLPRDRVLREADPGAHRRLAHLALRA